MKDLSRRKFLKAGAAGLAAGTLPFSAIWREAQAAPLVRYEASTPNGQAMLKKYAKAVAIMKSKSLGDPCSWAFQANTHWVHDDTTKGTLIATLPAAQQPLANDMWNTCQNHGGITTEDMFLPWHRMYVYYIERICRMVLNDPTFTMPYWNYNATATAMLPNAFLNPNNNTNSLYYANRNPGPQSGAPLTGLSLSSLSQSTYSAFCSQLDFGLHGAVHVKVGNGQGMGSVPWAANDPIFWMHHCNIDRLWASWNAAAGHTNPTSAAWKNQTFVFATPRGNSCVKVIGTVGKFSSISALGYSYDRLERVPGKLIFPFHALAKVNPILLKGPGPIEVGSRVTHVKMANAGVTTMQLPQKAPLLSTRLQRLAKGTHMYLLLDGLMAKESPGVTYNVYLNTADQPSDKPDESLLVGSINFFAAVMPGGGTMKEPPKISLEITDQLRKLGAGTTLSEHLTVSLIPDGNANPNAKPMVTSISLAEM